MKRIDITTCGQCLVFNTDGNCKHPAVMSKLPYADMRPTTADTPPPGFCPLPDADLEMTYERCP